MILNHWIVPEPGKSVLELAAFVFVQTARVPKQNECPRQRSGSIFVVVVADATHLCQDGLQI